jgi:MoxR-like ATPase
MFNVRIDYPEEEEELQIVKQTTAEVDVQVTPILNAEQITQLCRIVRRIPVAEPVARYALQLARRTRPGKDKVPDFVNDFVLWGAGPRASQYLVLGAKARAVLAGRYYVSREDIRAVALPVLRHRIRTNFNADAEGISPDTLINRLIEAIPARDEDADRARPTEVFRSADSG